jgi:hypothetical protein
VIDKHPLPNVEDLLNELNGACYFSKLDMKSAYHQLDLHCESQELTAFITHDGIFCFKKVPFGLASAPAAFQKMMGKILHGLQGVVCFIDDCIVYGNTKEEHDARLQAVLSCLQKCYYIER